MIRKAMFFVFVALLLSASFASAADPLPTPLVLPPGMSEVIALDHDGSFMGDAPRIVDCPKNEDNPFGVCGNLLFGGLALWNSHLTGSLLINFYPPQNNISHFEISQPFNLTGDDVFMHTPQLYWAGVTGNVVLDKFNEYSSGDLNLVTGEVTNLNYKAILFNSWYGALTFVNPKLKAEAFVFPGIYGGVQAIFEQRPDGLLDFSFYGSTFLPLGNNINGDPVRVPMPFCGPEVYCGSIQVPGMSLHPHLRLTTKASNDPPCGDSCISVPTNSVQEYTLNSRFSSIGDDFYLNIPQLGGTGFGRSQMQGRIQVQFGDQQGDFVPIALNALPPAGLLVPPPPFPINGLSLGFIGHDEHLVFPSGLAYDVKAVALTDDPFDVCVGELNVKTGRVTGGVKDLLWRTFWTQDLLLAILAQNNGRILPQSFFLRGPALFQKGPNGENVFRFNAIENRPFDSFVFPGPDYNDSSHSFIAGTGSLLTPFFRMQAVQPVDEPAEVMSGGQTNITSSFGEVFSYSYQIPCNPAGQPATFTYTNGSSGTTGGTFTMENLVAATCQNSLTSTQPAGHYDTVTFTGFGKWSKDKDPHVVDVQVSTAPDAPYVSILVDGGSLSNVNLKPAEQPLP